MRSAQESDVSELVSEPFQLIDQDDGLVKCVYLVGGWSSEEDALLDEIFEAIQRVRYQTNDRTSGLVTTSRIFGWKPRVAIRNDYCTATTFAVEQPDEHATVVRGARLVSWHYRQVNPSLYEQHRQLADEKVIPDFHLEDEAFTSGIINENNPLKYHFDGGNFRDVWSGMLAFRKDTERGFLALPAYDIAVGIAHKSLFLFDGQSILHGVTPIKLLNPDAKRYSIVYYSLRGMWNCEPVTSELERIRRVRTGRESRRAALAPKVGPPPTKR